MQFTIIAKTLQGLEPVLAKEIHQLGAYDIEILKRAVSFRGDQQLLYDANIRLRTALRILKPVYIFKAPDEKTLYERAKEFDWSKLFKPDSTFAIDTTIYSELYPHTQFPALRVKDAIADQFRDQTGIRPNVDRENPDVRINLHIQHDLATISLDSSGESLHKRGYRKFTHEAPMSETLASGLIMLSEWDRKRPFFDPMCGSGTLAIEAAMIANNIAPGLVRSDFGFKTWNDYDQGLYRQLVLQAANDVKNSSTKIVASDIDQRAVSMAKEHAEIAKVEDKIDFRVGNFHEVTPPFDDGLIITNPPYGERLKPEQLNLFYGEIGNTLKRKYAGFDAWIFSSNLDAIKRVGLKPSVKMKLKNGPLDCYFQCFRMRSGNYHRQKDENAQ